MRREKYVNAFIFNYPGKAQVEDLYTGEVYGLARELPGEVFVIRPTPGLDGARVVQALVENGYDCYLEVKYEVPAVQG